MDGDLFVSLMADDGSIRQDLKLPDTEFGKDIQLKVDAGEEVMVRLSRHL